MNKQTAVIVFTALYITGISAFLTDLILPFAAAIFILAVYFLFYKKIIKTEYIFVFLAAFPLGIFNTALNISFDDDLTPFSDKDIQAQARVISIPSNNIPDKTKFYAVITSIKSGEKEITSDKIKTRLKTLVSINDRPEKISDIKIGDTVKLTGRLKIPSRSVNPSEFDYAEYLQYKKTFSLLYVNDDWQISEHASGFKGKILSRLNDARNNILKIHARNIKSPMLEILGGIIFGDDAVNPDEDTKTSFINSGIIHILAASGMNVTLIFGIWFFFASKLRFNYNFSIIAGMLLIVFYTFMTGFGAPIIRAAVMLILILTGKLMDRSTNTIALLFLVCFLMLAYNPLMLFDTGFQLSFIVTFALILTAPLIAFNFKYKWVNNALGACIIPVIAQVYAAPLQMFYFNTFAVYSVFANIAVIPVLSAVSFLGFISSILALIPKIADKICFIADFVLNPLLIYIAKTAEFFSNLPGAIAYMMKPSVFQMFLYYAVITGFTCYLRYKMTNKKFLTVLTACAAVFMISLINIPGKNPEIIYFSVGNADSFLIKSADNDYFMTDTAKTGYNGAKSPAEHIMIKYMRDKGIRNLDALILSHFDSDHAGGTVDILKNIKVKKLYITDVYEDTILYGSIQNYVEENNIDEEIIKTEKEIYNKDGFIVTLIKPEDKLLKTENQKSLAVHISYKGRNFLFSGDGDIYSYNALPERYKQNITIIKSGHHGAKDTVNIDMAQNSKIFLLSTGHNAYNHPHPETLNTIRNAGRKYFRTDRHNAVKVIVKPDKTVIQNYSPRSGKFEEIMVLYCS